MKTWFDGYRKAAADLGYEPDPENIVIPHFRAEQTPETVPVAFAQA